jgi:hypothetical protein
LQNFFPIVSESEPEVERKIDRLFIWRTILLVLLSLSALAGGLITLLDYALHPVLPQSIKKTRYS